MAASSACAAIEEKFGPRTARADLLRYRRKGPGPTAKLLRDGIAASGGPGVHHTDGSPRIEAPDAAFDRFVSTYVLDLLSPEDIRAVLAEAHRVLEPSGLLGLVGLTFGEGGAARAVSWLWEQVHRLRPSLVGGCRPLEIMSFLPTEDWKVRHRGVVAPYAIASEIVVAERT